MNFLKDLDDDADIDDMKSYLRAHTTEDNKPRPGLESICIHPGTEVISESTSFIVVDYIGERQMLL